MIKYLLNHNPSELPIGQVSLIEDFDKYVEFSIIYSKNVSNEFVENSISFYKKEGMFISYDYGTRTLKYKIGGYD